MYTYDRQGILLTHSTQVLNDQFTHVYEYNEVGKLKEVVLVDLQHSPPNTTPDLQYDYNARGQISTRQFGNQTPISYRYSLRGWLTHIDPLSVTPFSQSYSHLNNGSLSGTSAMNFNHADIDYNQGFSYDSINRLISSSFIDHSNLGIDIYNEDMQYDSHGNITILQRTGSTPASLIDDLTANYWRQTNRVKTVSDAQMSQSGFHDAHQAPSVNVIDPGSTQLIISQVHYNSEHQSPQNAAEFIEIMNISTQPVNLKNWELDDVSHSQQSYRVLHDFWLDPGQRAVFANDWDGLYTQHYRYGYDFDLNDNTGQGQNAQGQNILRIRLADNGDDAIALHRPDGSIEDVMSWRGTTYGGYTWNLTQNGDKTMSLHRQQVNCSTVCSKPTDWAVAPRAPYAADYYYDAKGNRIIDKDSGLSMMNDARGMHFTYDERNLPTHIGDARYRYNAEGHRYYSEVAGVHTVTIMDGDRNVGSFRSTNGTSWQMSYWNIHGNGLEGRYDNPNVTYHKRFYHKDHLGSTRVVVDQSGTVIGSYDYYPFGLEMPGRSSTTGLAIRQKFTGHQRDEEVGLDYMVWRRYNPAFPVFLSVDPMASSFPSWSPYTYALNNPLIYIDPDGRRSTHTDSTGVVIAVYDDEDNGVYIHSGSG